MEVLVEEGVFLEQQGAEDGGIHGEAAHAVGGEGRGERRERGKVDERGAKGRGEFTG
jgi:hypothetical protein